MTHYSYRFLEYSPRLKSTIILYNIHIWLWQTRGVLSVSDKADLDKLKSLLEEEIKSLENKLAIYRTILSILEECSTQTVVGIERSDKQYRDSSGRLVAVIKQLRDTITLYFVKKVHEDNEYIRYALQSVRRLSEEYGGIDINIGRDGNIVKEIIVTGVTKNTLDEVLAILEFVAKKISTT